VILSLEKQMVAAVLRKLHLNSVKSIPNHVHGKSWLQKMFQHLLIGEIWMVLTIFRGTRTSTSHSIAVHAGPKVQHLQLLIGSTLSTRAQQKRPHQLVLMLKSSLIARLVVHVTEETQVLSTLSLITLVFHTLLANSTLHTTFKVVCVNPLICAVTALGHQIQQVMSL
jgi:hypothetical protein